MGTWLKLLSLPCLKGSLPASLAEMPILADCEESLQELKGILVEFHWSSLIFWGFRVNSLSFQENLCLEQVTCFQRS